MAAASIILIPENMTPYGEINLYEYHCFNCFMNNYNLAEWAELILTSLSVKLELHTLLTSQSQVLKLLTDINIKMAYMGNWVRT